MAKMGNLYDATKCTACRGCQVACKNWNQLPAVIEPFKGNYQTHESTNANTFTIVKFFEYDDVYGPKWYFCKQQCMHCEYPACVEACPRKALYKNEWGAVLKDYKKCVGCQYCVYACPFEIPKYHKPSDTVTKCTLCADRVEAGGIPACAKTCPTGALQFGERQELLAIARERVKYLRANGFPNATIYGEHELGGLNKLYILGDVPEKYGLPSEPKVSSITTFWQNIVQPWFGLLIPLALAGSAASFFTTRFLKARREQQEGGATHGTHN